MILKVNTKALLDSADNLDVYNSELNDKINRINNEIGIIGNTWKDTNYIKFSTEMESIKKELQSFSNQIESLTITLRNYVNNYQTIEEKNRGNGDTYE